MKIEHHFKAALLAGLVVSFATTAWAWRCSDSLGDWIFWLIWPAMLLHQCEENVFTELVLGRRFAFLRWVRTVGYDLTAARVLQLNVLVGWSLAIGSGLLGAGILGDEGVIFPLFVAAVEAVNGFWHLSVTALQKRWSPGALSSILVTIPLGFTLVHSALDQKLVSLPICYALFIAACMSHHLFLNSLPRIAAVGTVSAACDSTAYDQRPKSQKKSHIYARSTR